MWVNVTNEGEGTATNLTAIISGAELLAQPDETGELNGRVARGGRSTEQIEVFHGAGLDLQLSATSVTLAGSLALSVSSPNGKTWDGQGSGTSQSLSLTASDLVEGGEGTYNATISHTGGLRAISYRLAYTLLHLPPAAAQRWPSLSRGEAHEFSWLVNSTNSSQPPAATVQVDATVSAPGGVAGMAVHYVAGIKGPARSTGIGSGGVFLTSGEALGFTAVGILGLSVASGALRVRGGRAVSQERSRKEVTFHRLAWLAVVAVLGLHGLVQITAGYLNAEHVVTIVVGTAAFASLAALVWFNAFKRRRVLAMEWRVWLWLKLAWVAIVLALVATHIGFFGRHFAG
jgi:hypothetical protein